MPSTQRRMALTLKPHVEIAINDLADAMGRPAATVVAGLLEEMVPTIEGMAKMHRAVATGNKGAAQRALRHLVGDNLADLMSQEQTPLFKPKRVRKAVK